ncbi:hypothetical protein C8R46DRAFT_1058040 [Mycena filopes]|nr:hypothetical protein C8R46DRAFT_1058040 [Mycena filopes]
MYLAFSSLLFPMAHQNQSLPPLPDSIEPRMATPAGQGSGHPTNTDLPSSPPIHGPTPAGPRAPDPSPPGSSNEVRHETRPSPRSMSHASLLLPRLPEEPPAAFQHDPRSASDHRNGNERHQSELDWIVPKRETRQKTVGDRIYPTLTTAKTERDKFDYKAKMTGYALNIAIGLQVLLGALTTGLSAVTTGRQTSVVTSILGGLSTLVASYLARARGSNEPELSITRCKDLDQYIRECEIFILDHGHCTGDEFDSELNGLRDRFEELLGNANGERRLAPPV